MRSSVQRHQHRDHLLTCKRLRVENRCFRETGGISRNNHDHGFRPAFLDCATGHVYLSRFPNGSPAPVHLLDGLPDDLVVHRNTEGRVTAVKHTLVPGFLRAEQFYTREQAAQFLASPLAG